MIPELNLSELQQRGYREDDESRRVFERRYGWAVVPAVIAILAGACWCIVQRGTTGLTLFLGGVAVAWGATFHAARATPSNPITGHRMQRFRRSDSVGNKTEFIYVDEESRTYFVRLIAQPSS